MIFTIISFLEISGHVETMQKILKGYWTVAHCEDRCPQGSIPDPSPLNTVCPPPTIACLAVPQNAHWATQGSTPAPRLLPRPELRWEEAGKVGCTSFEPLFLILVQQETLEGFKQG